MKARTRQRRDSTHNGGLTAQNTPAAGAVVKTEGQRLLQLVPGTLATIGQQLGGTPRSMVCMWRKGSKRPTKSARAQLEAVFGIPVRAWYMLPGGAPPVEPPEPPEPVAPAVPAVELAVDQRGGPSTLAYVRGLLAVVQRDRSQPDILPMERARLANVEKNILALHAKVEEAAQLAEARYVLEHPSWLRLRRTIVSALEPHPLAAQAVLQAIEQMERSSEGKQP